MHSIDCYSKIKGYRESEETKIKEMNVISVISVEERLNRFDLFNLEKKLKY